MITETKPKDLSYEAQYGILIQRLTKVGYALDAQERQRLRRLVVEGKVRITNER